MKLVIFGLSVSSSWGNGHATLWRVLHELHTLWQERDREDEYIGTLVNAYLARGGLARGGLARGVHASRAYVDVGTLHGYREAIKVLSAKPAADAEPPDCGSPPNRESRPRIDADRRGSTRIDADARGCTRIDCHGRVHPRPTSETDRLMPCDRK